MTEPALKALILANVVIFGAQMLTGNQSLIYWFALWPAGTPPFEVWQLVSYSFLHGGVIHLLFNMYALWLFGTSILQVWGRDRFLTYYFVCVVGAAMVQLVVQNPVVHSSSSTHGFATSHTSPYRPNLVSVSSYVPWQVTVPGGSYSLRVTMPESSVSL